MSRKPTTSAQDATGRKRDQLQKEHAEELAKRGDEISLLQAEEAHISEHGVFDPETGTLVGDEPTEDEAEDGVTDLDGGEVFRANASASLAPGTRQVGDPATQVDDDGVLTVDGQPEFAIPTNDTAVAGVGSESPFTVIGGTPADERVRGIVDADSASARRTIMSSEVADLGTQTAKSATKVIRVNATLDQVTIGTGTEYNFREGQKYRVPAHVAAHLEEKGYVWH
jgi:hypothetical protein